MKMQAFCIIDNFNNGGFTVRNESSVHFEVWRVQAIILCKVLLLLAFLMPLNSSAKTYSADLTNSQWYLSASIFECSLTHPIPRYGKGVFYHEAGENLKFYLNANANPMKSGDAALVIEAPQWRPGNGVRNLGYVPVKDTAKPIVVERKNARTMMEGLMDGMTPTFTRRSWYNDESVRVRVSSVNFPSFYNDYLNCVASLLPVNFKQVERTKVLFKVDKAELTESDYEILEKVVIYVKADNTVTSIVIDGHTDSSGRRIYNRRLSKDRSEVVRAYFIANGIPEEMITTRYHGERYPVAKNNTKANKAKNRRTTVRLEKGTRMASNSNENATPEG
ncbi:flagellar protein MotY [Alkalimarinus sediminis]|uniref:OmpA family protein n=1 Tax=Alkalimarinus sediminis TaxID=1632866 RepID=A0A9E8HQ55_9ALTE|nr:OmpA family protein [Alkalimarinus sediminis]UZW76683.1 OmpA family protein [Alkalimarinus sediminis]